MIEQIEFFPTQQLAEERAEGLKREGYVAYVEYTETNIGDWRWQVRFWKDYSGAFSGLFPDHVVTRTGCDIPETEDENQENKKR